MQGLVIEKLEAENFGVQKHFSARIQNGTVIVRGENGAGKSTCMRTLPLYLMFGIDAIENTTLDDLVTEGLPVSSLKAYGTLSGIKVKRSKTAASVELPSGERITGQAEVTQYFRNLLGVRKGTEQMLLVADQDNVAGLARKDLKPSELTSFIEKLAGFSELDEFIDKVKEKFPSGNVKAYEAAVEANTKQAAEITTDIGIAEEELAVVKEKLSVEKAFVTDLQFHIATEEEKLADLTRKISKETNKKLQRERLRKDIAAKEGELSALTARLSDLKKEAFRVFDEKKLAEARILIKEFQEKLTQSQDYKEYQRQTAAVASLEADFEGTYQEFEQEAKKLYDDLSVAEQRKTALLGKRAVQISRTTSSIICPSCGSDISEKVKRINSEALEEIKKIDSELEKVAKQIVDLQEDLKIYKAIAEVHTQQQRYHPLCAFYIEGSVPKRLSTWTGETAPPNQEERDTAARYLADYDNTEKAIEKNKKELADVSGKISRLQADIASAESSPALQEQDIDTTEWESTSKVISTQLGETKARLKEKTEICNNFSQRVTGLVTKIDEKKLSVERLTANNEGLKVKIKTDDHNALLLKTAREARPKVIDHIWGTITTAVAAEYNTVTGFDIALEKSQKGFRIVSKEGTSRPMARLSGSEAAVMGNAFRVVLRDIFAPGCGFLIFDEPFASMSKSRTAAAAAALAAVPGQKIIITHDDETELAADQIIEV